MVDIVTDRSRILSYGRCERMRFLNYHSLQTGFQLKKLNLSLIIGTLVHLGRSLLLEHGDLEKAISTTLEELDKEFKAKEIDLDNNEDQLFVYEEQKAFVEAAIRVWYFVQYKNLLGEYEVVDLINKEYNSSKQQDSNNSLFNKAIEPEIEWTLVEGDKLYDGNKEEFVSNSNIIFMSRPDSILRSKSTQGVVVDSFKTTAYPSIISYNEEGEQVDKNKYDDQGISELIAVERLLGEEVEGIKMEFFVKGQRKKSTYTKEDGTKEQRKLQQSFLVHPWKKDNGIGGIEYSTKWEWTDEFGSKKRLGKGWNRVDIWKEMTVKEWVNILIADHYGDLEALIITPYLYLRSSEDIENWLESTSYQEKRIARHLDYLRVIEPSLCGPRESEAGKTYRKALNEYFPMRRESCFNFGRFCSYVNICFEGEKSTSTIYESRIPHHQKELVQLKGKEQ